MLTCRHHVDMFTWGRIVLSLPKRAHVDWNGPLTREKRLEIDCSVKMSLHWLITCGSCRLLVMGSPYLPKTKLSLEFLKRRTGIFFFHKIDQKRRHGREENVFLLNEPFPINVWVIFVLNYDTYILGSIGDYIDWLTSTLLQRETAPRWARWGSKTITNL